MTRLTLLLLLLGGCNLLAPLAAPSEPDATATPDLPFTVVDDDARPGDQAVDARSTDATPCPGCPFGCAAGDTCKRLVPANVGASSPGQICPGVVSVQGHTIDSSTCTLGPCSGNLVAENGRTYCLVRLDALDVAATTWVTGKYPLVIVAEGTVTISGTLDLSANGITRGPGGQSGGTPPGTVGGADGLGPGGGKHCTCGDVTADGNADDCGGGGGGHGQMGGAGGQEGGGCGLSTGGSAYGSAALEPLIGGSGGASGHNAAAMPNVTQLGAGGAGGGALQISAQGTIRVEGAINVGGGGGQPGVGLDSSAGGGGGSGGAILLEASQVLGAGWLAANGGGGGGGAESANGSLATVGQDGAGDATPAAGGQGGGTGSAGGTGGTGTELPQPGVDIATAGLGGCGGGGGAAGRIRVNVPAGALVQPQHSGAYSVGLPRTQ